jgi:hypothetical protein
MVAPGLAALDTVLVLHDAKRIGDPRATWGVVEGNPVHDDVRAIAAATGVTYSFDVILNTAQQVVAAFGGDVLEMHAAAVERARAVAMAPVDAPFDVVVTSGAGFPLDQNLYQSVKGMSAAYQVVRPGGLIVCAAECADGFPDHGSFREVLTSADSPQELLDVIAAREVTVPDQWQVQIQARIQAGCRVVMHTSYLSDADLADAELAWSAPLSRGRGRAVIAASRPTDAAYAATARSGPSPGASTGWTRLRTSPPRGIRSAASRSTKYDASRSASFSGAATTRNTVPGALRRR